MLDDGIYIVKRSRDMTLGPEKTMRMSAYNDREIGGDTFNAMYYIRYGLSPEFMPFYKFLLGDGNSYLANYEYYRVKYISIDVPIPAPAHINNDGEVIVGFDSPGSASGTITNVSIQAYGAGKIKTIIRKRDIYYYGTFYTNYYGTESSGRFVWDWIESNYPEKPGGDVWTWSDITTLTGGIWVGRNSGGLVRKLKVVVTYGDGQILTLYPNRDISSIYTNRTLGNPFLNRYSSNVYDDYYWIPNWRLPGKGAKYSSNFSQIPPAFSQINSIKVYYGYSACLVQENEPTNELIPLGPQDKIAPFLYINRNYYHGAWNQMQTGLGLPSSAPPPVISIFELTHEWTLNPENGKKFTLSDINGIFFGLDVPGGSHDFYTQNRFVFVFNLYVDIKYQEIVGDTVEYVKLHEPTIKSFVKYTQNPIHPDELSFSLPPGNFLPERTEIVLVDHGEHIFDGVVWHVSEDSGKGIHAFAKSKQVLLDYRHFPNFSHRPRNGTLEKIFSIKDVFSDEMPTHPFYQYIGGIENEESQYNGSRFCNYVKLTQQNDIGIFFILNSYIPQSPNSTGKVSRVNPLDRPLFSFSGYPSITEFDFNYPVVSCLDVMHVPIMANDYVGGLHRLSWRSTPSCIEAEFSIVGNDLYIAPYAGSRHLLCDHLFDTHLRPGTNEFDDLVLNVPYTFKGTAGKAFDDFFSRLGEEIEFRPNRDGNVYLNAATEISRGSTTNPVKKYKDSYNCQVKKTIPPDPRPDAVVGNAIIPLVSSDWIKPKCAWISEVISDGTRSSTDLQESLDMKRADDPTTYDITIQEEDYLLRPGDWIWAMASGEGYEALRVKEIGITPGFTHIRAGHRTVNLSASWGAWRNAIGSSDTDQKIQSQEIDFDDCSGSKTFTVLADNARDPDWKCRLKVDVDFKIATELEGGISQTTIQSNGGAVMTSALSNPSASIDANYDVKILSNACCKGGRDFWASIPTWTYRKNGGSWQSSQYVRTGWPNDPYGSFSHSIGDGITITFSVSYGNMDYNGFITYVYPVAGSQWHIETVAPLSPLKEVIFSDKNMFFIVALNGKVVPPGRIKCYETQASFEIDLTDSVSKSSISDTVNTIVVTLKNGLTKAASPKWYQVIKGSVAQYKRVTVLENA